MASYESLGANRWREKANLGTLQYTVRAREIRNAIGQSCAAKSNRKTLALVPLAFLACCGAAFSALAQQSAKKPAGSKAPAPAAAQPTSAPFRAGETLDYTGEWLHMSGSVTAKLSTLERRPFYGREAWHIQAQLHTNGALRYILPIDDQFDSYSNVAGFVALQFEMYLHESGKTETDKLRLSSVNEETPGADTVVKVLPETRDPVGFAFYLRTVDWQKTAEVRGPVYDGHKLYDVRASLSIPKDTITVAAGKFVATGIAARIFDSGTELTSSKIVLWLAQDAARTPILVTVDLPVGTGRIELVRANPGK